MSDDSSVPVALRWRLLAAATALLMVGVAVVVQLAQSAVFPPLIVLSLVLVAGLAILVPQPRAGVITIGAAALVMLLANLPYVGDDLAHPESVLSFLPAAAGVVGGLVGALLLVVGIRGAADDAAPYVAVVAAVALVAAFAVSVVASSGYEDDRRQEGDFGMFAQDIEFDPDELTAPAGEIGIYIGNDDLVRHNLTIDDLEVDEELPAKAFVRFAFETEPGTYEYYCDIPGHEDMTGTLTVGGS